MISEFFTGSYAKEDEEGITRFEIDLETGKLSKRYSYQGIENPSYLLADKERQILYAVEERTPEGFLHVLEIKEDRLIPVKKLSTHGADPCHLALSEDKTILIAANYTSGSLIFYPLDPSGIPKEKGTLIEHRGKGKDPVRQEGSHVHFNKVKDGIVYTVDLGMDQIVLYQIDPYMEKLTDTGKKISFPAGSGPRHLVFPEQNADEMYAVCELSNETAWIRKTGDDWKIMQMLSMLPEDFKGQNTAAAIRETGKYILTSSRGYDGLTSFLRKPEGNLRKIQSIHLKGKIPRVFEVFGKWIVTADQGSDEIEILSLDRKTGMMEKTGMGETVLRPTCICRI